MPEEEAGGPEGEGLGDLFKVAPLIGPELQPDLRLLHVVEEHPADPGS